MPKHITSDDVAHVARLARLELSDDELAAATAELGAMLEHFEDIDALDLTDIDPMTQPYRLVNVMRDDAPAPTLEHDEVLDQAPAPEDGQFRVPPIGGGI